MPLKTTKKSAQNFSTKPWKKLTSQQKLHEAVNCAHQKNGWTVNLNFSKETEAMLKASSDPMRTFSKRFNKQLHEKGLENIPILLALEATRPGKRLHAHGIIICNENELQKISNVLRQAGGFIQNKYKARQLKMDRIYDAFGWAEYISKSFYSTRKLLGLTSKRKLWWMSRPLTQLAREAHTERLPVYTAANFAEFFPLRA
ncbi:hypothetical protein [Celeribacter sp.]|uniref:hypothetical protein n=1 Tax=Celeribacter sp. TaxID=1890673 RepID=UPI003A930800